MYLSLCLWQEETFKWGKKITLNEGSNFTPKASLTSGRNDRELKKCELSVKKILRIIIWVQDVSSHRTSQEVRRTLIIKPLRKWQSALIVFSASLLLPRHAVKYERSEAEDANSSGSCTEFRTDYSLTEHTEFFLKELKKFIIVYLFIFHLLCLFFYLLDFHSGFKFTSLCVEVYFIFYFLSIPYF